MAETKEQTNKLVNSLDILLATTSAKKVSDEDLTIMQTKNFKVAVGKRTANTLANLTIGGSEENLDIGFKFPNNSLFGDNKAPDTVITLQVGCLEYYFNFTFTVNKKGTKILSQDKYQGYYQIILVLGRCWCSVAMKYSQVFLLLWLWQCLWLWLWLYLWDLHFPEENFFFGCIIM